MSKAKKTGRGGGITFFWAVLSSLNLAVSLYIIFTQYNSALKCEIILCPPFEGGALPPSPCSDITELVSLNIFFSRIKYSVDCLSGGFTPCRHLRLSSGR